MIHPSTQRISRRLLLCIAAALLGGSLVAADNYTQRDVAPATGLISDRVIFRSSESGGVHVPHVIVDGEGATAGRSTSIATSQATLSTAAQQVLAVNSARRSVLIRNTDASISIYVGAAAVTSTTGLLLKAGESVTINSTAAIYAVAASGTPVIHTLSEND